MGKISYKIEKLSRFRVLANHLLSLSRSSAFPVHLNMDFCAHRIQSVKKETGYSFTAILAKVIAQSVKEDERFLLLNSYLLRSPLTGSRLVVFDDVSFSVALPKEVDGEWVASLYILENVNKKPIDQLDQELKAANNMKLEDMPIYKSVQSILKIPSIFYGPIFWFLKWFPSASMVAGSSMGMTNLGNSPIRDAAPVTPKTVIFSLGGAHKTLNGDNQPESTFTLNMIINHFVVDGLLCSEFFKVLKGKLESLTVDSLSK